MYHKNYNLPTNLTYTPIMYFRLLKSSDQTKENIDTQSTENTHLRGGGSTTPKIWNHTTSWKNGDSSPPTSPTQHTSETLSGRIELFDNEKPNKKTKKSKLCLILWYCEHFLLFLSLVYWIIISDIYCRYNIRILEYYFS